jgi:dihydroflavonol-4-reductase
MKNKRLYIITGAKGHLASTIIRKLRKQDCQIRGLILPEENGRNDEQITYYEGDVTKPETLDAIFSDIENRETIVIHAAGIISIQNEVTPALYKVNVEGTKNVVSKCVAYQIKRLIYISSVHAIPESDKESVITEVEKFSPDQVEGAYASTKAEASQAVLEAAKQGLEAVIVHPSGIVGPYDRGNNHIVQLIKMYITHRLPAGVKGGYDFVDVRDVAAGVLAAVEKGVPGQCYILSNRYITIKELLECMRKASPKGRKKICVPIWLAKAAAPLFEKIAKLTHTRALFTKYSLDTMESNGHFSHEKATKQLGYRPRAIEVTIADTIRWLCRKSKKSHCTKSAM